MIWVFPLLAFLAEGVSHGGDHAVEKRDWIGWKRLVSDEFNTVVEIKGYPKSGTTWLEYVMMGIARAYCAYEHCEPEVEHQRFFRRVSVGRTHILVNPRKHNTKHGKASGWKWSSLGNVRYVVIVRDPRANLVSYRFWSGGTHVDEHLALSKHTEYMHDLWKTIESDVRKRYQTYLIQYEYLLSNPDHAVKDLAEWIGLPLDHGYEQLAMAVSHSSADTMRGLETEGKLHGESHLTRSQKGSLETMDPEQRRLIPVKVRSASIDGWMRDSSPEDRERWEQWIREDSMYPRILRECYLGECYRTDRFLWLQHLVE
jgi:hypothetical protein